MAFVYEASSARVAEHVASLESAFATLERGFKVQQVHQLASRFL
ncbi:MAG: hypothetical protein Q3999_08625 [Buchananella hordeovulneris]|nr:hypothetical protein [Buchananella hordeovulneris]